MRAHALQIPLQVIPQTRVIDSEFVEPIFISSVNVNMYVCMHVCVRNQTSVCVSAYFFLHIYPPLQSRSFKRDGENKAGPTPG